MWVADDPYRSSGATSRTVLMNSASSARSHFKWTRCVEAGCLPRHTPGRRSVVGRIGRGTNPPPQFGQTLNNTVSTQLTQNVHS